MPAVTIRCPSLLLAATVLVLFLSLAPSASAWTDCSSGPAAFKVADVKLEPNPVKPGDTANFTIKADAGKEVGTGTVQMVVHYAGMPIWTQLDNLCDKAADGCPISPGPIEVRYSQLFPAITPPGYYDVTLNGHSGTEALFCVKIDFQVVPPSAAVLADIWSGALSNGAAIRQHALSTHRKSLA